YNYGRLIFTRAESEPGTDYQRWDRKRVERVCWEMICKGFIHGDEIVSPVVGFEESAKAYCKYVDTSPELSIKLGVAF
ncbi:MAG: alcohol dehydrogenase, partial [Mesotoga sp.]|nr:alcohol dehydrogenase [Mesotoga sp.]